MGLYEGRGQLAKSMKQLLVQWTELRSSWDDPQARLIESEHLHPLELDLRTALAAMDHMAGLLQQIKRDCSGDL